jgi:hypothetical protein
MITPWQSGTKSQQLALLKFRIAVISETIARLETESPRRPSPDAQGHANPVTDSGQN